MCSSDLLADQATALVEGGAAADLDAAGDARGEAANGSGNFRITTQPPAEPGAFILGDHAWEIGRQRPREKGPGAQNRNFATAAGGRMTGAAIQSMQPGERREFCCER